MARFHREIVEERRLMDVVALLVPLVNVAAARWDLVPFWILIGEVPIESAERLWRQSGLHDVSDFAKRWPKITQEDFFSLIVLPDRLTREIDVNPANERERDDQRRRHQKIRLNMLMHARLEVPVSRKNRSRDQIVFMDGLLNVWM